MFSDTLEGDKVMDRVEESVEIDAPVQVVYDQWARFEEFPDFIEAVKDVRWIDDTHLHWRARLAGEEVEWNAEIVEQIPFESIAWRGGAGMNASGRVRFEPFDTERTRVTLTLELDPEAVPGHLGDAPDVVARQLGAVLDDFKRHVEAQDQAKRSGTPGVR